MPRKHPVFTLIESFPQENFDHCVRAKSSRSKLEIKTDSRGNQYEIETFYDGARISGYIQSDSVGHHYYIRKGD